mmetsp:Transcript_26997/g.41866  ORF Transcript_26997/g.41866 Transcript_26997/m.41866 type:complete len:531 (+) Transcript_26997:79-1671(+)|eukprot:CAMPEP_0196813822 /NCGR_PEP_ID=MMETSP1362-20130617/39509_1 /TAXON_ID=163516 /ORGANISM="Leptocylindrus danicus, Strain CCMP1856" /LENGTH=530 /DNA_ID=CAMNT_0042190221 /DNA_START=46 /DNA_END=1638 /DNA_ORIENTATION=-
MDDIHPPPQLQQAGDTNEIDKVGVDDGNSPMMRAPAPSLPIGIPPHHSEEDQIPITSAVRTFALCAALNSCNLGYDIGVNTGAADLVRDDLGLSDNELEIFLGSINLFGIIGAVGASWISDQYGRRKTFKIAAYGFILGLVVTSLAQEFFGLMLGRIFVGMGVGCGLAIDPLYIAEISPAIHRGNLVTWSESAINLGIIFGFSSLLIYSPIVDGVQWRIMIATGAILPCVMIYLANYVMPESPRWLVAQGKTIEAREVLAQLYPAGFDVATVVEEIKESLDEERRLEKNVGWGVIVSPTPAVKRMLIVGVGSAIAQQICGIDAIQYYLVEILEDVGVHDTNEQAAWLILLGCLKFSFLILAGRLFDSKGRRPLFFISLTGMAFSLLAISFNFFGGQYKGVTIVGLASYMSFFSLGMGPGAWLIPSEVFFTSIRAKSMSIATFTNRIFAAIMAMTVLSAENTIGWGSYFLILSFICCICLAFFYFLVPETKGKHLEEMAAYFAEITNDSSIFELGKLDNASKTKVEDGELT